MSLAQALDEAQARLRSAGIADAELEAEVLLRHALGLSREELFARLRESLTPAASPSYEALLCRRLVREPTAYITGRVEFYGLELTCTRAAMIPRPETELLVEEALAWVMRQVPGPRDLVVADVGTGNGAIAIAIAVHAPRVRVVGIDTSSGALELARQNARTHGVAERIGFVRGSLLAAAGGPFDLIVANLPYVPTPLYEKLPSELREHEPEKALHAGRRGTALIEPLLAQAPALLRPGGLLLAEHAWNQGRRLRKAAQATLPNARIETKRDLAGRDRVLILENT